MTTTAPSTKRIRKVSVPALWTKLGYEPHEVQSSFHRAAASSRFRCVSAGRRTGKSHMGGHELTLAAVKADLVKESLNPKGKRHEYWIVGPEYSDAEKEFRVMYNDLLNFGFEFDKPGTYYDVNGGNMNVSLFGGRFLVSAKSAKYPDTLVGEGLKGVILVEAAKLKEIVWTKYIRPTLADYKGWATMTSTPEGKNWFYREWQRGQDGEDPEYWSLRAPSWSNPVLFPGGRYDPEIVSLERGMSSEKFKQEIGADFTEFVGRVFKDFEEESHVKTLDYDPGLPVYIAQDIGFTNPTVILFLQVDVFDNVKVLAEYYQRNRTPQEVAQDVAEDPILGPLSRVATRMYGDPADPSAANTMANAWKVQSVGGTGGLIQDRLDLIRRWLKPWPLELPAGHPEKIPRLLFDRSCKESIREMLDYRYPETRADASAPENPMKKDDHVPEALGRFFKGYYGQTVETQSHARVSTARMRSHKGR